MKELSKRETIRKCSMGRFKKGDIMTLFPFSIADIDDPECIRVVLYASGRMGHAPLNALLKKAYEDITKISKRMDALEKKLNTLDFADRNKMRKR